VIALEIKMKMYIRITILSFLFLSSAIAAMKLPLDSLSVGGNRILFNCKMTLKEAIKLLRNTDLKTRGDASESLTWICYHTKTNNDSMALILKSGEIGGGTFITVFDIARPGLLPELEKECSLLSINPGTIATDRGISLGMMRTKVEDILGPPTEIDESGILYKVIENRHGPWGRLKQEVDYSVVSTLRLWFSNEIVIRISGFRMDQS